MLLLYTTAPLLFRASSSPFYNLSLLTSNFWSLLIGFAVFNLSTYWREFFLPEMMPSSGLILRIVYGLAFPLVIVGLLIYFSSTSPAHQADERMVVRARGKKAKQAHVSQDGVA